MKDIDKGIFKSLKKLKNISLEVGVFADARNNDSSRVAYVADYAIANEFGVENSSGKQVIPKRSFIRSTSDEQGKKWQDSMDRVVGSVIDGASESKVENELRQVGQTVRRDIIEKIDSNIGPDNAPSTKRQKLKHGKTKTLINSGALRQSIEARVKKNV